MMRNWEAEYRAQVEVDSQALRQIELKQVDDSDMDMPVEEEVGFVRRWLNKYGEWARRVESV